MKFKRILAGMLTTAMSISLLTGCGSSSSGNEIIVNLGSEPSHLNSILATGSIDGNVFRQCMEGLVALDENDEAIPAMATKWEESEDKMTYTFHLRKDAKWSNGEKVTAKDFEYGWDQLFNLENAAAYASTWAPLFVGAEDLLAAKDSKAFTAAKEAQKAAGTLGYEATDDYTFVIHLTAPYVYIVPLLSFMNFFPVNEKAVKDAGGVADYATEADNIVTNGAFNLTEWTHEDSIVLEKNEEYWNAKEIKLDKCTMRMITDTNTSMNEFKSGNIDMIGLTGDQNKQLNDDGTKTLAYNDGSNFYMEYNTTEAGLNNAKVRQALTIGLDAEGFVKSILKNDSQVATSFTPPAISQGTFKETVGDLITRPTDGDYSAAKALLEEGLAEENLTLDTFAPTMIADEGDSVKTMCEYIQEQLKKNLGVTLKVEQLTYKARLQRMDDHDFSIVMAGWGPDYNDPMTFMDLWVTGGGNNHTSWSNAEYDSLIKAAQVEGDAAKRTEMLVQAEKILAAESPIGPIYYRTRDYVCSDKVKGIFRSAFQDLDITGAYIEE